MRKLPLWILGAVVLMASPAYANPKMLAGMLAYGVLASMLGAVCVGWATLAAVVWRKRVVMASHGLSDRPTASLVMGFLAFAWLLLSMGLAENAGGIFGPLAIVMLIAFVGLLLAGLPALLQKLGRGFFSLRGMERDYAVEIMWGGILLFLAGALPWLGWLLLLGSALACSGAALLSWIAPRAEAPVGVED